MATKTHANNSQEEILSAIKSLRLELHNREEYLDLPDRADRLFSKIDGDAIFAAKKAKLRIDPPKFNGDDPLGWIYKVQSYFDYFETSEKDRLRLVGLLFEHRASNWLLHQHDNNLVTTWPEFLEAVKRRFDPIHGPNVVLGALWLKTLGEIYRSYDKQTMEFTHNDKVVTLRGLWEKGQHIVYNAIKE